MRQLGSPLLVPVLLAAYAASYVAQTYHLPLASTGYPLLLIGLLCVFLALIAWTQGKDRGGERQVDPVALRHAAIIVGATLLYAVAAKHLGFALTSAVYLSALLAALGNRGPVWLAAVPVGTAALLLYIMGKLFELPLPSFAYADLPWGV